MGKIIFAFAIIFLFASCSIFYPYRDVKPDKGPETRKYERSPERTAPPQKKEKTPPVTAKEKTIEEENVFNASFTDVWFATLGGVQWIKWPPVFADEKTGEIILKEAYVYKRSGNIMRTFAWPTGEIRNFPDINDYLNKVAFYDDSSDAVRAVFSQESMRIKVTRLSNTKTKVDIEYAIRPYLDSEMFAEEVKSNSYIETLLLDKIRENLKDSYINTTYLED